MGIFDDYEIDIESVKESNFDIEDGTYRYTVALAEDLDGTENKPDTTFFIIDYELEDENGDPAGQKRAWYTLAEDGDASTKRAKQSLSFLKADLLKLGLKGHELSGFTGEELIGRTGTLTLKTVPSKKPGANPFQNIRNIKADDVDDEEPEEEEVKPRRKAAAKPAAKAAPAKARKPKPAPAEEEDEDDEDGNPFGG